LLNNATAVLDEVGVIWSYDAVTKQRCEFHLIHILVPMCNSESSLQFSFSLKHLSYSHFSIVSAKPCLGVTTCFSHSESIY